MHDPFELDDIEDDCADGLPIGGLCSIGQDIQTKATELGALRRLRGFDRLDRLLRELLIHWVGVCSFRGTAARAIHFCRGAMDCSAGVKRRIGCATRLVRDGTHSKFRG